ncbi:helix-turn-helix transcriptional regulator [Gaetbulibacter jejuensis]|uniref:HTH cro/C1-type domain-containing protein n=1 Tax=Gaetbulibacter jejuensis TaxID=584607 RepID=A0ABP3V6P5_9FLAO
MLDIVTIKDVKVKLGEICKQQRKIHELSREDLADALDVSRTTIQNFENGNNATLDTVLKITNHFDLLEPLYKSLKDLEDTNNLNSLY